ncbi:MAG: hypothetical protein B9S32_06345 [Verrucomicrobia bacterium Tous-C9LFEB]|nr:MAG: hypothetical protein B9S32_06345 [Verrucomicrobia bacterium Tous-C9LFEB]
MKTIRACSFALLPCLAFFVLASGVFSAQGALYSETFDNTSGANKTSGQIGWSAFVGSSALNLTNVAGVTNTDYVAVASAAGNPGTPNGFIFANNGATANQTFALVDTTLSSPVTLANGDSITWTMGNNSATATAQILIQIGGDGSVGSGSWYVSTATRTSSSLNTASFQSASESAVTATLTFSTSMSSWKEFTLSGGNSMAVGNTLLADLSSTTITGIGFYLVDTAGVGSSMRLDTLQIVPEPGSLALVLAAGLASLLCARRRQSRAEHVR